MATSKTSSTKKATGKNSDPVNKFKTSKTGGKLTPGTASVPSANSRAKEQDAGRRGDAASNKL